MQKSFVTVVNEYAWNDTLRVKMMNDYRYHRRQNNRPPTSPDLQNQSDYPWHSRFFFTNTLQTKGDEKKTMILFVQTSTKYTHQSIKVVNSQTTSIYTCHLRMQAHACTQCKHFIYTRKKRQRQKKEEVVVRQCYKRVLPMNATKLMSITLQTIFNEAAPLVHSVARVQPPTSRDCS